MWTRCGVGAAALVLTATMADAQSLADVARQEQARRKQSPKPAKVYTNQDLAPVPLPATPAGGTAAGDVGTTSASAGETATASDAQRPATDARPEPEQGEKYWRERMTTARADLDRAQTFAAALEARIGALTQDFVNRDDPAQRAVVEQNRQKAVAELERVQREIADRTKAIAAIEDEARKAGVPAGWLR